MGLDMYLTRKVHIANYEFDPKGSALAAAILKALKVKDPTRYADASLAVHLPAAYWRKANAIHKWFVDHVQNGVDNCEEFYVSKAQLGELRALCDDIVNKVKTPEALPPQGGFFFGSTDVDEGYYEDLKDTIKQIDLVLSEPDVGSHDSLYYCSSW